MQLLKWKASLTRTKFAPVEAQRAFRFELAFLFSSVLPLTGSLKPLWHSPQWWQIFPEDSTAPNKCIVLLVNPLLRGEPQWSCNWPHLLVLASAMRKLITPRKAKAENKFLKPGSLWNQGPVSKPGYEGTTCSWWLRATCSSWPLCPFSPWTAHL